MVDGKERLFVPLGECDDGECVFLEFIEYMPHCLVACGEREERLKLIENIIAYAKKYLEPDSYVVRGAATKEYFKYIKNEISRRKDIFKKYNVSDIESYLLLEDLDDGEAVPSLCVVFEEQLGDIYSNEALFIQFVEIILSASDYGIHIMATVEECEFYSLAQMARYFESRIVFKTKWQETSTLLLDYKGGVDLPPKCMYYKNFITGETIQLKLEKKSI